MAVTSTLEEYVYSKLPLQRRTLSYGLYWRLGFHGVSRHDAWIGPKDSLGIGVRLEVEGTVRDSEMLSSDISRWSILPFSGSDDNGPST